MEEYKTLKIYFHDSIYNHSKIVEITDEEEKEIIQILKESGLEPTQLRLKSFDMVSFWIGGFIFYLAGRYGLDPVFEVIDNKIKEVLLKDKKRKHYYEKAIKEEKTKNDSH